MKNALFFHPRGLVVGIFLTLLSLSNLTCPAQAAIPPVERILPASTLFVAAVPNADKFAELRKSAAQVQLWEDPAMKPFRENFLSKWKQELVAPLERELGIHFADYTSLPHGLIALAVLPDSETDTDKSPGVVFLLDAANKSAQLKTNLITLRQKWTDAGKIMRTEKLHGVEFMEVTISSGDMPKTLKKFLSDPEAETLPATADEKKPETKRKLVIGQFESLLIIANSPQAADSVATRLSGSAAPILADVDSFSADQAAVFRDAPFFAWANLHDLIQMRLGKSESDDEGVGPMQMFKPGKIIAAIGLNELRSVALGYRNTSDGIVTQIFFRSPEATRQGLLKLLTADGRDSSPPSFVPAEVIKFQRWRLDGQKTWAGFEKVMRDISPSAMNGLNFFIESANSLAQEKEPGFDLRKKLIGNLGNDFISYQKTPRDTTVEALRSPPTIFLIGSPNPSQMAGAFQSVLRLVSPSAPTERDFLGRTIYTVTVPGNPVGGLPEPGQPFTRRLSYVASSSYVAFSTDVGMLEEYLRSAENPPKALRETPGLTEAAQKVSGTSTGWFGYENQNENMRLVFETLRKSASNTTTNNASADPFFAVFAGIPGIGNSLKSWADFSLLPSFEKISKYFFYSVFAGDASADGLTFKVFAPTPPELRK